MDDLPPELQHLQERSIKAQERVNNLQKELREARQEAKDAHITFDNALQEHLGQTTLLDFMEEE